MWSEGEWALRIDGGLRFHVLGPAHKAAATFVPQVMLALSKGDLRAGVLVDHTFFSGRLSHEGPPGGPNGEATPGTEFDQRTFVGFAIGWVIVDP